MFLIQILLPRPEHEGDASTRAFAETRAELVEKFEGVTAYVRAPAQGLWTSPEGRIERDDVVMVEVLAPTFDRVWWRAYADRLASRFRQKAIHIRALPAMTPDGDAEGR
jgi:hypothetical protein